MSPASAPRRPDRVPEQLLGLGRGRNGEWKLPYHGGLNRGCYTDSFMPPLNPINNQTIRFLLDLECFWDMAGGTLLLAIPLTCLEALAVDYRPHTIVIEDRLGHENDWSRICDFRVLFQLVGTALGQVQNTRRSGNLSKVVHVESARGTSLAPLQSAYTPRVPEPSALKIDADIILPCHGPRSFCDKLFGLLISEGCIVRGLGFRLRFRSRPPKVPAILHALDGRNVTPKSCVSGAIHGSRGQKLRDTWQTAEDDSKLRKEPVTSNQ